MADGAAARRLTDQGRERRQQLLDGAAALFAERGYADTRVVDICASAGVAKGLFYWYFENKQALFADLVRSMRLRLRAAQAAAIDDDADPLTRIRQGTEASVRFMAQHRAFFALLEVEQQQRTDGLHALLREGTEVHTADTALLVKEAQAAGQVPEDRDPQLLALGVVGAVAHFSHFHRSGRIELDVDALARFVGEWVTAALAN
jgi:TetR/AcrR family transcriptional regulator, transcriptional repressor for nem operon